MSCVNDGICAGQAIDAIWELPTIDTIKNGHWRYDREIGYDICSECGSWGAIDMKYCPWCGAKMDKKEE